MRSICSYKEQNLMQAQIMRGAKERQIRQMAVAKKVRKSYE